MVRRKRPDISLGGLSWMRLAEARTEACGLRAIARKGGDLIAERRKERTITPTFEAVACEVHLIHAQTLRNYKHAAQWITSLKTYAFPNIGNIQIDKFEPKDILA